jgi:hypothetical protein
MDAISDDSYATAWDDCNTPTADTAPDSAPKPPVDPQTDNQGAAPSSFVQPGLDAVARPFASLANSLAGQTLGRELNTLGKDTATVLSAAVTGGWGDAGAGVGQLMNDAGTLLDSVRNNEDLPWVMRAGAEVDRSLLNMSTGVCQGVDEIGKFFNGSSDVYQRSPGHFGDALTGEASGFGKALYGAGSGLLELAVDVVAPGQGADAYRRGSAGLMNTLSQAYQSTVSALGADTQTGSYVAGDGAGQVLGAATLLAAGAAKPKPATIVPEALPPEAPIVPASPAVAEIPGPTVDVVAEPVVEAAGGGDGVPPPAGRRITGGSDVPDEPMNNPHTPREDSSATDLPNPPALLPPSTLEPLPDLSTLGATSPELSVTPVKAVPLEIQGATRGEVPAPPPTTDVARVASRPATRVISAEDSGFLVRRARDGTQILTEYYKGPTAGLQREAMHIRNRFENMQPEGREPYVAVQDVATGQTIAEIPNARMQTPWDEFVNIADRATKPPVRLENSPVSPLVWEAFGRVDKIVRELVGTGLGLALRLVQPSPPRGGAPSTVPTNIRKWNEFHDDYRAPKLSDPRTEIAPPLTGATPLGDPLQLPSRLPQRLGEPLPDLRRLQDDG